MHWTLALLLQAHPPSFLTCLVPGGLTSKDCISALLCPQASACIAHSWAPAEDWTTEKWGICSWLPPCQATGCMTMSLPRPQFPSGGPLLDLSLLPSLTLCVVIGFCSCCNKEWLKTTETYSPTLPWKVRNPGVSNDLLLGISEKESVTCISQFLVRPAILGVPWFVDSPLQFLPLSSHVLSVCFCLCPFSSYKDTSHTD